MLKAFLYKMKYLAALLFSCGLCNTPALAQNNAMEPRYVLVQLCSENNRIEALTKARRYKELEEVKKDARGAMRATIKDFKDHFTYCPVYFFVDTNVEKIRARQFDGILFDTGKRLVTGIDLTPESKDYLIAYFGTPVAQPASTAVVTDGNAYYSNSGGEPSGKGLVICNYKFQQVKYFYRLGLSTLTIDKERNKGYYYFSKHFNIEYFPLVSKLSRKIPYPFE